MSYYHCYDSNNPDINFVKMLIGKIDKRIFEWIMHLSLHDPCYTLHASQSEFEVREYIRIFIVVCAFVLRVSL